MLGRKVQGFWNGALGIIIPSKPHMLPKQTVIWERRLIDTGQETQRNRKKRVCRGRGEKESDIRTLSCPVGNPFPSQHQRCAQSRVTAFPDTAFLHPSEACLQMSP